MKEIFFILIILAGCATTQRAGEFSVSKFLESQLAREKHLEKFSGKLEVRLSVGGRSVSGPGKILRVPGKLRLEIQDPMGTPRYILVGNSHRVIAYYDADRLAYEDLSGGKNYFGRFYGLELDLDGISKLWTGVLPPVWRESILRQGKWDGREVKFEVGSTALQVRVSEKGLLESVNWKGKKGQGSLEFSDWDSCCSFRGQELNLGHEIRIVPSRSEKVDWSWGSLDILPENPNPSVFEMVLPKGTKKELLN